MAFALTAPLTLLLVEDSRLCAERFRLMARACGIRLRWAESLSDAQWHLRTYRPDAVIVDIGLGDGTGLDLIRQLRLLHDATLTIMAISAEPANRLSALAAGADSFLEKDNLTLSQFRRSFGGTLHAPDVLPPLLDHAALQSDLRRAADCLAQGEVDYAMRFLHGVARDAEDQPISGAVTALTLALEDGIDPAPHIASLSRLLARRLAQAPPLDH